MLLVRSLTFPKLRDLDDEKFNVNDYINGNYDY